MGKDKIWAKAGLVFMNERDLDIVQIANQLVTSVEALGHRVTGVHILSDRSAHVCLNDHEVHLTIAEDVSLSALSEPATAYVAMAIANVAPGRNSRFARDSLLARALQALHAKLQPDYVKWIDTDVILTSADFASAAGAPAASGTRGKVTPRRVRREKPLPDIEETNNILQKRISDHDPEIFDIQSSPDRLRKIFTEDYVDPDVLAREAASEAMIREEQDIEKNAPRRLSAWLISFAVMLFALPVGITLLILNLVKGENLRLASQTAALTGTFVAFQTFGTTANAMTTLQTFLG
ncbi:MAG: hypothetical protein RIG84_08230 [Roseovarius sp.]